MIDPLLKEIIDFKRTGATEKEFYQFISSDLNRERLWLFTNPEEKEKLLWWNPKWTEEEKRIAKNIIERLLLKLKKCREYVGIMKGETEKSIQKAFKDCNFKLTEDVLMLYKRIGGMSGEDDDIWRFWGLEEIVKSYQYHFDPELGLAFADFRADGCIYYLKPLNYRASAVYIGYGAPLPMQLSHNVFAFFKKYLENPAEVLF